MKNIFLKYIIPVLIIATGAGCKKYLDINSDPDTPQDPSSSSVFPPCLAAIPTALQSDGGVYVAKYVQNWLTGAAANANTWDQQGYTWAGGTMAATWSMTYLSGKNLRYIIDNSIRFKEYDYVAAAMALQAWEFQHTTDYNSDIPFYEAFIDGKYVFNYQSQPEIYKIVDSLCRVSLKYLDSAVAMPVKTLSKADFVYSGDLGKWRRFVYGTMARNWHHLTNKAAYKTNYVDSVLKFCDSSMVSVADDFGVPFDANLNANSNYFGPARGNMESLRQSNFIVRLLDGTALAGSNVAANRDPRMAYMLTASNDTTNGNGGYRGVDPGVGDPYFALGSPSSYLVATTGLPPTSGTALTNYNNSKKKVSLAYGDSTYVNAGSGAFGIAGGKYLFQNKAVYTVMSYAEIQFIKAEAALRKGDNITAYAAYLKGINAHFDFINKSYNSIRAASNLYATTPVPAAARTKYLASASVKQSAGLLTLTDVMLQKYIALWGWGFFETWVDMRRYHYIDVDPTTNQQVYKTFALPVPLFTNNENKPVYRVRPHYTSEFTYNYAELDRIGALKQNFHTTEMWFSVVE